MSHPFLSNWQSKNMVARIYTTMCFLTSTCQNASCFVIFQISNFVKRRRKVCRDFFVHLASARYVSLGHVVAIDPLIDSIPESSIDCWASAVLHLKGQFFLICCQQRSICWVPATFFLPRARTFRVHSLQMRTTDFTTMLLVTFHQRSIN